MAAPERAGRSVFAAVRAAEPSLQPGEARVARLFLEEPRAIIHQTISQAAQAADVSTATVVRCAQKLGFKGFHEIKLTLAQEIAGSDSGRLAEVEPCDSPIEILRKVAQAGAQAIVDATTTVSAASVEAVVRVLAEASSVLFVGVGTSAPLAADAAYRFKTTGLRAEFPADAHVQHVSARLLGPGDVCFAISHTGSTRETLTALKAAKEAGATTVAVTSFAPSPLTELVDHVIVAGAREVTFHLEAVGSRLAHMAVLDALLVAVALRNQDRATAAMNLYAAALSDHRLLPAQSSIPAPASSLPAALLRLSGKGSVMRGHVRTRTGEPRPAVLVSDGRTVTATAHDGSWSLDPAGPFVFVTRPAGWTCDGWFTRPSAAYDFVLDPLPDIFPHRFVHVSDTHLGAGPRYAAMYPKPVEIGTGDALTRFLARLPELVPDVSSVVATGDLTDYGLDEEFAELRAAVASSPVAMHLVPGNHDHMNGVVTGAMSRNGYALHAADPAGYERNIGPRWYSYDLPGLHVIALDWHTHEMGIDHEAQDAWMRADLEAVPFGMPWILLSHDQPWHSILGGLPWQPRATFSGHRHSSRVIEINGTLHVNTPTPLFGALDFSPPSFRVVTWDGERIALRTRALDGPAAATFTAPELPVPAPPVALWRHQLAGAGHRAAPRVHGDTVLVAVKDEDRPAGGVEALDLATGALRWRSSLASSVKGAPVVHGATVIAVDASGNTVGLDLADGTQRWRMPSPDPLRLFAFADPTLAGDAVIVGDLSHLRALDAATGALRWERRDLSPYQSIVGHAAPVLAGDVLVVGAWPSPRSLVGLDPATGATRWPQNLTIGDPTEVAAGDTAVGTPLHDPKTGDLFVSGLGFLARIDAASGDTRWHRPMTLPWNPAAPVATDAGIAAVDAGHRVVLLDRETGDALWQTRVDGDSPFAMSSYQRTPHPLFASPALLGDRLLVPGLDSRLHVLDLATGAVTAQVPLGTPVAAPPVVAGNLVLLVGTDGGVLAIAAEQLR